MNFVIVVRHIDFEIALSRLISIPFFVTDSSFSKHCMLALVEPSSFAKTFDDDCPQYICVCQSHVVFP